LTPSGPQPIGVQRRRRAPTISDWSESLGLTNKTIAIDNIVAQSRQEESDAAYSRSASKYALFGGDLSAGADILKAAGPALVSL
jgi:hypothetical protein